MGRSRFKKGPPLRFIVDGANVAYMNQNFYGGGFSYDQIDQLVTHLAEEYCASWQEILLLLPQVPAAAPAPPPSSVAEPPNRARGPLRLALGEVPLC